MDGETLVTLASRPPVESAALLRRVRRVHLVVVVGTGSMESAVSRLNIEYDYAKAAKLQMQIVQMGGARNQVTEWVRLMRYLTSALGALAPILALVSVYSGLHRRGVREYRPPNSSPSSLLCALAPRAHAVIVCDSTAEQLHAIYEAYFDAGATLCNLITNGCDDDKFAESSEVYK